jgi:hypothetical protein
MTRWIERRHAIAASPSREPPSAALERPSCLRGDYFVVFVVIGEPGVMGSAT